MTARTHARQTAAVRHEALMLRHLTNDQSEQLLGQDNYLA